MTKPVIAVLGVWLIGVAACGSNATDRVAPADHTARPEPLRFGVDGMRRVNGAL